MSVESGRTAWLLNGRRGVMAAALVAATLSCGTTESAVQGSCDSDTPDGAAGTVTASSPAAATTTAVATTTTAQSTTTTTASTTTTTAPATTTTAPATTTTVDRRVVAAQQRLSDLGYWLGSVDGAWGPASAHAAVAFQKVNGLPRTGILDDALLAALDSTERPTAREAGRPGLEIDRDKQVAFLVVDGSVRWVLDVSSGTAATATPAGDYTVTREIDGNRVAPLGTLYRPKYFHEGYAVHGFASVPTTAASHGCVRVTFAAMDLLWAEDHLPVGARVTVY